MDSPNAQMHDESLYRLSNDTSIKSGGVRLVLWATFPHVNKLILPNDIAFIW